MGINCLYSEIGAGERTALSKLAVEHYEKHNRPFRLAVDISIWNFQNRAAMGGKNPELRTLYYRLLRLLSLSIQPLFVFDGPNKPPFKRGVKTNPRSAFASAYFSQHTKDLISLFGFQIHQAKGEAEAECALLQQAGIVDAVLSEDVDSLMFGCTMHLRNWSCAGTKGKVPTHVDLYRAEVTHEKSGLDREGMILIAMMSGGDYLPGGVEGCGIKTACQAAKAKFGKTLCNAFREGSNLDEWRDHLQFELNTNEGGYFSSVRKTLQIPTQFPDMTVLGYYMYPARSSTEELEQLSTKLRWSQEIKVPQLRLFVAEMFEWESLSGAKKFIRGLAPALLVSRLQARANVTHDDLARQELEEKRIIKTISQRRHHFETDATAELRVEFLPCDIVNLNLAEESRLFKPVDHIPGTDSEAEERGYNTGQSESLQSPRKPRIGAPYDPTQVQRTWLIESFVKIGVPLLAESWEEQLKQAKPVAPRKTKEVTATPKKSQPKLRTKKDNGGMKRGALDSFSKVGKAGIPRPSLIKPTKERTPEGHQDIDKGTEQEPSILVNRKIKLKENIKGPAGNAVRKRATGQKSQVGVTTKSTSTIPAKADELDNPFTKSKRPPDTFNVKLPPRARYSTLGIYGSDAGLDSTQEGDVNTNESFVSCSQSPSAARKHARPISSSSINEAKTFGSRRKPFVHPDPASSRDEIISLDTADEDEEVIMGRSMFESGMSATERPCTPAVDQKRPQGPSTMKHKMHGLTAQRVNRILNFNQSSPPVSPGSGSDSLPSPSTLFSPKFTQRTGRSSISPSPQKRKKGLVLIRDSLPGAWRDVGPEEATRRPSKVISSVDIVDLT